MDKSVKRKIGIVLGVTAVFTVLFSIVEIRDSRISEVVRNTYGGGSKKERFEVTVGERLSEEEIDVEINERLYTEKEIQKIFKRTMDRLEKTVLGENESVDRVEHDLNLITKMKDAPLEIEWESNRSDIINSLGEIQEENLTEEGTLVELKGFLTYGEEKCLYILNVMVYPRTLTVKEKLLKGIRELTMKADSENPEQSVVHLPGEIDGEKIVWEKKPEHRAMYLAFLGGVSAVAIYVQERQKKEKEFKERERQMRGDYSEVISQISLLTGAGMTVKNAWKRIVSNYQENKEKGEERHVYEEMIYTMREMQGGVSEAECYEHFGKRCGLSQYMKLGTLLSQNTRKGTKGLVKILDDEAGEALEEKKQMAKKRGEEISTKLLIPMSLMLIVVLVIVIVPAFLSITL